MKTITYEDFVTEEDKTTELGGSFNRIETYTRCSICLKYIPVTWRHLMEKHRIPMDDETREPIFKQRIAR